MHGPVPTSSVESRLERLFSAFAEPRTARADYWAAAAAVGVSILLAWGLHPWLEDRGSFLIFIPAVLFASGFGGLGPGLLATALSLGF
jgi:two-component system sensor kinase FixL